MTRKVTFTMAQKTLHVQAPYGAVLRANADGSWDLIFEDKLFLQVRDWAANLANYVTAECIQDLETKKTAEAEKKARRAARLKEVTGGKIPQIASEIDRLKAIPGFSMMSQPPEAIDPDEDLDDDDEPEIVEHKTSLGTSELEGDVSVNQTQTRSNSGIQMTPPPATIDKDDDAEDDVLQRGQA